VCGEKVNGTAFTPEQEDFAGKTILHGITKYFADFFFTYLHSSDLRENHEKTKRSF
jgi:hypothetical protein